MSLSPPVDGDDQEWTLILRLQFFSLFDSGRHDDPVGEECVVAMMIIKLVTCLFSCGPTVFFFLFRLMDSPLRFIPRCHHTTAKSLRQKVFMCVCVRVCVCAHM